MSFASRLALVVMVGLPGSVAIAQEEAPPPASATVVKVYDGDTLTLQTGDRVRLRWVNTPELRPMEAFGEEAGHFARKLCLNKQVSLLYGSVIRDGYGRLIAGVEIDDKNLSEELLEHGLGHLFVIPPDDSDLSKLVAAQERARAAKRGIWSTDRYQGDLHITSFHANADGDDRKNVNGEYLRLANVTSQPIDLAGYRITDLSGRSFVFPAISLPPGHTVKVHSGQGDNQGDAAKQIAIYLGNETPIWNNKRDQATIYDPSGKVVDSRRHEVQ